MSDNKKTQMNNSPRGPMMGRGPGGGRGPMGGGPPHLSGIPGDKASNFKGTMKTLLQYLGKYKVAVFFTLIVSAVSTVFMILGPKILGRATTGIFEGVMAQISGTGGIDFGFVARILITVLILYLISTAANYIQGWIMAGISAKVTFRLRKDIEEKINRMPLGYFDTTSHGEVLSRITNDVETVSRTLSQSLTQVVTSVATVAGVLVMMFSISWMMTLVALVIIPVSMIFVSVIIKKSQKYFKQQQDYLGHVNGHVEEMFSGHVVMKAFNGEKKSIEKFSELNDTLYTSAWKSQFLTGLMHPIMMFVGNLGYVGVSILGGYLAVQRAITVGDIQAFIQYVRSFMQPLTQLANISNILQQTAAAAERVFEFLDEPEQIPETDDPLKVRNFNGKVEFANVNFGYTEDKVIINDFSAVAEPGQKVAIVGPTGAGKTTMVKLLMRFYDINKGKILIDGNDITDYSRRDLRRMFGMVLQDTWLFNGTVMENIRYGRPGATDEEVYAAAKTAHADHFIKTLPGGYSMVINEEASNISQGQMQLLTIARAILADPKMLILDEATSSVDTRTEIHIQKAMDNLMAERTSFIIAHRLSTIKNADLILFMKDGDIVEQGNHEQLMAAGGFYSELYNSQFEKKAG